MNNFNLCGGGFPAFGNHHDKPFDGEQKGLGKIFYKSDFSVWLADPTGDKTTPFTLTFYVGDLESTYTAGFDGLDYKRCKRNEDGSLLVFFDRHALPCGRLMLRVEIDKADPDYGDGEQNTADKLPLPIILWDGATSYEPTMAYALAPYIVGADGKPFTYDDLTEEEKKDLGEKATAELAATVQRSYNAADKEAMEAIEDPKEGDLCTLTSGDVYTYHLGEWVENADGGSGFTVLPAWISNLESGKTYTAEEVEALGGNVEELKVLLDKGGVFIFQMDAANAITVDVGETIIDTDYTEYGFMFVHPYGTASVNMRFYNDGSFEFINSAIVFAMHDELDKKADASDLVNVQRSYTAADKAAMDAITYPKEGYLCVLPTTELNVSAVKKGDVINKITAFDAAKAEAFYTYLGALGIGDDFGLWYDQQDLSIMLFNLHDNSWYVGDGRVAVADFSNTEKVQKAINSFNALAPAQKTVDWVGGIAVRPNELTTLGGESPVTVEVQRKSTYTYHDGAWVLQTEKADVATTPALLTAADADAMNALTTAKDGDRCIVGGNAIYDRVGGKWYFTAGVQPAKTVKASELKAGDKIKAVNFDTSKTPAGTGDGIFCTIGGVPIEMMAFIDSLSYGTGKTPLFTGTWNTANTAACSAAMAGKTVDSVAASMAALSANVDDWLSFEIE